MKHILYPALVASALLLGAEGCQRNPAEVVPAPSASQTAAAAGTPIRLEQAAAWTQAYRDQHPGALRAVAYSAEGIRRLLAQPGCTGLRINYATNEAGEDSYLLTGVGAAGRDEADGVVLDGSPRCPPWCAISPLSGEDGGRVPAPQSLPISAEQAARWTGAYQRGHRQPARATQYAARLVQELLQQKGLAGIRIYQALRPDGQLTFVLVGTDGAGQDQTGPSHAVLANGRSCATETSASPQMP